jgi:hypothetical protein
MTILIVQPWSTKFRDLGKCRVIPEKGILKVFLQTQSQNFMDKGCIILLIRPVLITSKDIIYSLQATAAANIILRSDANKSPSMPSQHVASNNL